MGHGTHRLLVNVHSSKRVGRGVVGIFHGLVAATGWPAQPWKPLTFCPLLLLVVFFMPWIKAFDGYKAHGQF